MKVTSCLVIKTHRNMYVNIDKSGHIKSFIYGLTIGFEP